MIPVPAGTFLMGSPPTEPEPNQNCFNLVRYPCSYADVCCGVTRGTRDYICDDSTLKWTVIGGTDADAGACGPCPDAPDAPESEGD